MAAEATIYGVIEACGQGPRPEDRKRLFRHNRRALSQLPATDTYPPLVRGMFGVTYGPMVSRWVYAIHFGWMTRNFAEDWVEWEAKFHALLRRLVWISTTIHVDAEWHGDLKAEYAILPHSMERWWQEPMLLNNEWHAQYTGWIAGWEPPVA